MSQPHDITGEAGPASAAQPFQWVSPGGARATFCQQCGHLQVRYGTALLQIDRQRVDSVARWLRTAVVECLALPNGGQPVILPFDSSSLSLYLQPDQLRDLAGFFTLLADEMPAFGAPVSGHVH